MSSWAAPSVTSESVTPQAVGVPQDRDRGGRELPPDKLPPPAHPRPPELVVLDGSASPNERAPPWKPVIGPSAWARPMCPPAVFTTVARWCAAWHASARKSVKALD